MADTAAQEAATLTQQLHDAANAAHAASLAAENPAPVPAPVPLVHQTPNGVDSLVCQWQPCLSGAGASPLRCDSAESLYVSALLIT